MTVKERRETEERRELVLVVSTITPLLHHPSVSIKRKTHKHTQSLVFHTPGRTTTIIIRRCGENHARFVERHPSRSVNDDYDDDDDAVEPYTGSSESSSSSSGTRTSKTTATTTTDSVKQSHLS